MIARLVKGCLPALAALLTIALLKYLISQGVFEVVAIVIASATAVVFTATADEVITYSRKHLRLIRKVLDPRARFEGDWFVETTDGARMPYGFVAIEFSPERDAFVYKGYAYDQHGSPASEWICDNLEVDVPKNRVRFLCDVVLIGDGGSRAESYGWVTFDKILFRRRLRYYRGSGFFSVISKPDLRGYFSIERLNPVFVKCVLGTRYITTHQDIATVVRAYHEKKLRRPKAP